MSEYQQPGRGARQPAQDHGVCHRCGHGGAGAGHGDVRGRRPRPTGLTPSSPRCTGITTMTTTGYGDITPKTGLGRIITSMMMLLAGARWRCPRHRHGRDGVAAPGRRRAASPRTCPECLTEGHLPEAHTACTVAPVCRPAARGRLSVHSRATSDASECEWSPRRAPPGHALPLHSGLWVAPGGAAIEPSLHGH